MKNAAPKNMLKDPLHSFRYGFRARVFWSVTLLVLSLSIFFTTVVIYQQKKLLKQDLVNKGLSIVTNLARDSELGVFTENHNFLEPVLLHIIKAEGDIVYTVIYNIHGKVIANHTKEKGFTPQFPDDIKMRMDEENGPFWKETVLNKAIIYEFWAPVSASKGFKEEEIAMDTGEAMTKGYVEKGRIIGAAHAGLSLTRINARLNNIVWTNIAVTILFLPIAFILTYLIARRIAKPIVSLKNAVEVIEKGVVYERIDSIDSRDEIGHLVSSFNSMVDALNKKDEEIMHHVQELVALNLVSSTVNQSLDLKSILHAALREVLKVIWMEAGWIYLPSEKGDVMKIAAYEKVAPKFINKIDSIKLGEGIAGRVLLSGKSIISNDITNNPMVSRDAIFEEGFKAFASIPLRSRDKTLGALNITSHSIHAFTHNEVELLYSIGNQIGTAIENSMLYERLKKQLEEIERTQEQLIRTARLASLGELAANVAHEINNPLTGVLINASMMIEDTPETDPARERLNVIYDETMRVRYIVRNLLDFARQTEPRRVDANIVDVLKDTLYLISHLAKVANVEIKEEYEEGLPMAAIDVVQIKQVFLNLFNNAIYAMPDGGVLSIGASSGEGWVNIHIQDTGTGIPKEIIHKIFDPFFTTKTDAKGTGLGLSISHGIIERHSGTIDVKSEIDKGSVFTVRLPAV